MPWCSTACSTAALVRLTKEVGEACLVPYCADWVQRMSSSARAEDRDLPPEERQFRYVEETPAVKGTIMVDDEENFGQKIPKEVESHQFEGLRKGTTYYAYVNQNAEQEAADRESTRLKYSAAREEREASKPVASEYSQAGIPESCSCTEGAPCVDEYGCKDWKRRFEIATQNGWKGF